MSDASNQLAQTAIMIANNLRRRTLELEKTKLDLQGKLTQVELDLELTNASIDRLGSFSPDLGGELICPDCWIVRDTTIALTPIAGTDKFRCRNCQFEFSVLID